MELPTDKTRANETGVHGTQKQVLTCTFKYDMFKAFDQIDKLSKSNIIFKKRPAFLHACATCFELPSSIIAML